MLTRALAARSPRTRAALALLSILSLVFSTLMLFSTFALALQNGDLFTSPYQTNAGINDVYTLMLSFRYTFN